MHKDIDNLNQCLPMLFVLWHHSSKVNVPHMFNARNIRIFLACKRSCETVTNKTTKGTPNMKITLLVHITDVTLISIG